MPPHTIPTPLFYIGRTLRVSLLSLLFALAFVVRRLTRPADGPRLLRWYFETCGGAFVKFGQFLAMRFDLLPVAYCEELSNLLDRLPPLPAESIIPIIESDLNDRLTVLFADFEPVPIATASVAQVHGARLPDGARVVVKVMRPGVTSQFRVDLFNVRLFAHLLDLTGLLVNINAGVLADEFSRLIHDELDFHREARSAQFLHELMAQDDIDHYAPRVYFEHCGQSVITLERLEGVWMTEMLAALNRNDTDQLAAWARQGITPRRTARLLLRSILTQCYTHRMFHADPHAANLVVLDGGTLGYVDFGLIGWLDERAWALQFKLREYIANEMIHAAYETLLDSLSPLPYRELPQFEYEVKDLIREYILASKSSAATMADKSSGLFFLRMFDVIRRSRLSMPASVMRLYRTMVIADAIMLKLDPTIDWLPDLREFIRDETGRQIAMLGDRQQILAVFNTLVMNLVNAPQIAGDFLDWAQHRLPELGRTYIRQLSLFEQISLFVIQYLRIGAFLLGVALIGVHWAASQRTLTGFWANVDQTLGSSWWLAAGASLLAAFLLDRLMRRLGISQ